MTTLATWFDVEQAAKFAKLYRTIAQARRTAGDMSLCRQAEATARQYESMLRDYATEIELDHLAQANDPIGAWYDTSAELA